MELGPGRALYTRFAVPSLEDPEAPYEQIAVLLEDAVQVMQRRCCGFADGLVRKHIPTVGEPLVLVLIDEIANLTAYLPDRKVKERINRALGLLLTQGRAPAVVVVGALQDPRREVITLRSLFPDKVALRLDSPTEVEMVLGDGAREQGAYCDRIPASLPGLGYVRVDGVREPTRVRAGHVTDEDIAAMVRDYTPAEPWMARLCSRPPRVTLTRRSSSCPAPATMSSRGAMTAGGRRHDRPRRSVPGGDGRRHRALQRLPGRAARRAAVRDRGNDGVRLAG
jgi:hypothetical protein